MSARDMQILIEAAAAIMFDERLDDSASALRIAAKRHRFLGNTLPKAQAVQAAFLARLRLLDPHASKRAAEMRVAAIEAMRALDSFQPRVYGHFLSGAASVHSIIHLQARCDHPDTLMAALMALNIPIEQVDVAQKNQTHTHFEFKAGVFDFHVHALIDQMRFEPDAQSLSKLSS